MNRRSPFQPGALGVLQGAGSADLGDATDAGPVVVDGSATVASGQSEHALFRSGKIGLDEYMDMTVDRAVAHLQGAVSAQRLQLMRQVLREQLVQDPHLVELLEQAG